MILKVIFVKGAVMAKQKTTYKYHLRQGKKVVHRGITDDPDLRENEHKKQYPGAVFTRVGRKTTLAAALRWEREGGKRAYKLTALSDIVAKLQPTVEAQAVAMSDMVAKLQPTVEAQAVAMSDIVAKLQPTIEAQSVAMSDIVAKLQPTVEAQSVAMSDIVAKLRPALESQSAVILELVGKMKLVEESQLTATSEVTEKL